MNQYKHPRHQRCREATLWNGRKSNYLMICCKKNPCFRILQSTFGWPPNYLTWISSKKASEWTEANCHQPRTNTGPQIWSIQPQLSAVEGAGCLPIGLPMDGHKNSAETISPGKNIQCSKCDFLFRTFLQWLRISKNRNEPFLKRMPLGNIIRKHSQVATIAR